jgi:hypothetical protein
MQMQHKEIIQITKATIGTPFVHQGRLVGQGLDCLGLLVHVLKEVGSSKANLDNLAYHKIPPKNIMLITCRQHFQEITELELGAFVILEIDKNPSHIAIITDHIDGEFYITHAYYQCKKVVEHILPHDFLIKGIFRID